MALARVEIEVVEGALPPPSPPPRPPLMPRPTEGSSPRLVPEDPALTPNPRPTEAETERPADADTPRLRIGLLDGPRTTPPLTPTLGLTVAVTATHPFKTLPPLSQVVIGMLAGVEIVTKEPVGELIPPTGFETEGELTLTPAPAVTDTAIVAETPTGRVTDKPVTVDSSDETPPTTAAGK